METTGIIDGMEYVTWKDNGDKIRIQLYPEIGLNTEDQVKDAVKQLRTDSTVFSIQVRWKHTSDDTPMPEKIPDHLIIKQMRVEEGKMSSYILELEEKCKQLEQSREETKPTPQERQEIHKDLMWKEQQAKIRTLEAEVKSLRRFRDELIARVYQKQEKE